MLSTPKKRAICQKVVILFGMRLGAFFLNWLCATQSEKSQQTKRSMFFDKLKKD